jgi:Ca-activated chloride channel homolog
VSFAAPYLLIGLVAVPLAVIGYLWLERRRTRRAAAWSNRALLPNIVHRPSRRLGHLPPILLLLGLVFLLVGFARPQRVVASIDSGAPTIVLTFDVSGSMAATDVQPTRIRAARAAAVRFLDQLPSKYRVAVVTFADQVHLSVAPTFDRKAAIAGIPTSVTPKSGTAIGDGITYAVSVAASGAGQNGPGSTYRPGAVLLFSDGAQTGAGPTPSEAAVSALVNYVPIDTVAVGTKKAVVTQPVTVNGVQTSTQISVPLDSTTLRTVASQTGGIFLEQGSLTESPDLLTKVYSGLHTFKTPGEKTRQVSAAFAAGALVCILAGIALSGLWFGRIA